MMEYFLFLSALNDSGKRTMANYLFGFTQYKYMYSMVIALFLPAPT